MGFIDSARTLAKRALGITEDSYSSRFTDSSGLSQIALADWLGALPDTVVVNRRNALTIGTVASARHTLAGMSRLPLYAEQGGTRVPQALQPALLGQPEIGVPRSTTLQWTYDALFFQPCTWWHILKRDYYGWPTKVQWVSLDRAELDSEGRLIGVDKTPVRAEDVIRFDSPLGDGFLKNARRDIQRAIAINLAAAKAEDSPIPAVELHNELGVELTEAEKEDLLDKWAEARRTRGVAYTPKGLKVIAHGKPTEALLIDGRRAIALELVRHANMPAWAASNAVEGATMQYDNRNSRNWELIDLTEAPYLSAVSDRLSLPDVTPRGWDIKVDTDELTKDDLKTRFEAYEIGKRAGFIDNDWIAAQEGWATTPKETK